MEDSMKHLRALSAPFSVLRLAVFGMSVLCVVSCRTVRSVERHQWSSTRCDTLVRVSTAYETVETAVRSVAGDSVSLLIPMDVMQSLPDGAVFTKKHGRTRLSVKRRGDALVAEAETDSIGQTVSRYERKARDSLQCRGETTAYGETSTEESPTNNKRAQWVLVGMIGTIVAIILIKRLK